MSVSTDCVCGVSQCRCVYVLTCIRLYIHMCISSTFIHANIFIHTYMCVYQFVSVSICVLMSYNVNVCVHVCVCALFVYVHTYVVK